MAKSVSPVVLEAVTESLKDTLQKSVPSYSPAPQRYYPVLRNSHGIVLWYAETEHFSTPEAAIARAEEIRKAGFQVGGAE